MRAFILAAVLLILLLPGTAHAYIGPGAGFAFAGSLVVLLTTFVLAVGTILVWPILWIWRRIRVGNPLKNARVRRVVILGLDGMDPGIMLRLMDEGRLPNFRKLAELGVFRPLATTMPSMSPVAWSTFSTGVDPSRHAIYDFLTRDPRNYQPALSSTDIRGPRRVLSIGRWRIPLSKPVLRFLQRSQAFWKILGEKHIFSIVQRVPITFPAVPFEGLLLSAMCVPDLRGSQGTFSFFSTATKDGQAAYTGGEQTVLRRKGNVIRSRIVGPENTIREGSGRMTLPFTLTVAEDAGSATIEIDGHPSVRLEPRAYSPWVRLVFKAGLGIRVHGIARFYLMSLDPEVNLYMTAVHIDPEDPAMPVSHPATYSMYLARKQGPFATLGLAEDTWALNERVLDEQGFLEQVWLYYEERRRMFLDALAQVRTGLVTTVFDTSDRIQHMFYRYLDPTHPANEGKDTERHREVLLQMYERMDALLGEVASEWHRPDTLFMVVSDHGFTSFRRCVNLNAWLRDEGLLVLEDGKRTGGEWFQDVDWSLTKAYAMGLTGLFLNLKGREAQGIVNPGEEARALKARIVERLEALLDPADGHRAVRRACDVQVLYDGPYCQEAPDVLVGWEGGYRHSWECATGTTTEDVFSDNTRSWSGDHCVDPTVVPGILFCNRPITTETPRLMDVPASVLRLFGQSIPRYMLGRSFFPEPGETATISGLFDGARLDQSGRGVRIRLPGAGGAS
ncbi:MAG: alkaline phosphatase family protein [Deltaproteobacteria bacterium]|nr:alkaline phosphatase family protein [Deltaproteobacteria bacterium]